MSLMFLDSIGGGEFIFIILIVLMLFGAESIPNIARTLGRGIRQLKDATQEIQRDIAKSADNPLRDIKEVTDDVTKDVKKALDQTLDK